MVIEDMEDLNKVISGDWYDVRQLLDDHHRYEELLEVAEPEMGMLFEDLRMAVERGTVELKRKTLNGVLTFVDSLQFDARSFQDFDQHIIAMRTTIYLALLQRSFCTGEISPRRLAASDVDPMESAVRQTEFKTIVEYVQKRIADDPSKRNHPLVKNILLQVGMYRRELENMKELAPNIPKEKSAAFTANYKKTFEEITRKVQDNYAGLLKEEEAPAKSEQPKSMFKRFELKGLTSFFSAQAQELTRIRSVLSYAGKERYKTREILSEILKSKERSLSLIEREIKEYERFWFGHGPELAREFAAEIAAYLARRLSVSVDEE